MLLNNFLKFLKNISISGSAVGLLLAMTVCFSPDQNHNVLTARFGLNMFQQKYTQPKSRSGISNV